MIAGALKPTILKAWSPGAQTIPMVVFSNFERWSPWSPEKDAMEPWSTAILPSGAQSLLRYALETQGAFSTCTYGEVSPIFLGQNIAKNDIFGSKEN